ncbi:hypothetical protein E2986_13947 [Frieseomelitta varia]|uniref:Uncharacterized protein n=1 Tax=Frieseomelitta varia TaxID=561572 RepID=A0A833S9T0_9HYME|nr:hypothetical protein E2986_13947 [Frieseomelitta varia]
MGSRTFSSNDDVVVASRLRIGIGDDLTSGPPKGTVKIMSVTYVSSIDEHLSIRNDSPANGKVNESKGEEGRDSKGSPFKMNCGRLFKPGQLIKLRFPSSSHVVHGIERDDLYYRRRRGRDWFRECSKNSSITGEKSEARRRRSWKQQNNVWCTSSSNAVQSSRKRRVGIVENQYVAESDAGSLVCDLARRLERVLGEKNSVAAMKSKKQQKNAVARAVDPIEENETYDEFDTVRMPVVRSLSKSPQSDEGIETDTDRRRGSMARCWSLDSAAASDEDTSLTIHQQKRHKLRVTRCCSSDSAVLSDEDQIKGWDSTSMVEGSETEHNEGRPRYWRTPSVVVSDYSDYSYLDEKLERNDLDLEKYEGTSGTPSQASSCSCLDCDEIRESLDTQFLQVCRSSRRHSDSCCLCPDSMNAVAVRNFNEAGNRRNSCLDSTDSYYTKLDAQFTRYPSENSPDLQEKTKIGFLNIPPARKISDCSTTSSLSGDESDVAEPQVIKTSKNDCPVALKRSLGRRVKAVTMRRAIREKEDP